MPEELKKKEIEENKNDKIEENKNDGKEEIKNDKHEGIKTIEDNLKKEDEENKKKEEIKGVEKKIDPEPLDNEDSVKMEDHNLDEENTLFKEKCKLFRFDKKRNKVEQRGVGFIFISLVKEKEMFKITMVRDKIFKLGCNHFIEENMELIPHKSAENTWMWQTRGDVCDDGIDDPSQTYIVKFNEEEIYNKFRKAFEEAKQKNTEIANK